MYKELKKYFVHSNAEKIKKKEERTQKKAAAKQKWAAGVNKIYAYPTIALCSERIAVY
jgi:hypothetical protein